MGFSRQEYWRGLPFPPPGTLLDPGIEPMSLMSPALVGWFLTTSVTWEAQTKHEALLNMPMKVSLFCFSRSPGGTVSLACLTWMMKIHTLGLEGILPSMKDVSFVRENKLRLLLWKKAGPMLIVQTILVFYPGYYKFGVIFSWKEKTMLAPKYHKSCWIMKTAPI